MWPQGKSLLSWTSLSGTANSCFNFSKLLFNCDCHSNYEENYEKKHLSILMFKTDERVGVTSGSEAGGHTEYMKKKKPASMVEQEGEGKGPPACKTKASSSSSNPSGATTTCCHPRILGRVFQQRSEFILASLVGRDLLQVLNILW